jgi:hypothetical protein
VLLFLCRHVVHAACVSGGDQLPSQPDPMLRDIEIGGSPSGGLSGKIALYVFPCGYVSLIATYAVSQHQVHLLFAQRFRRVVPFVKRKAKGRGYYPSTLISDTSCYPGDIYLGSRCPPVMEVTPSGTAHSTEEMGKQHHRSLVQNG